VFDYSCACIVQAQLSGGQHFFNYIVWDGSEINDKARTFHLTSTRENGIMILFNRSQGFNLGSQTSFLNEFPLFTIELRLRERAHGRVSH